MKRRRAGKQRNNEIIVLLLTVAVVSVLALMAAVEGNSKEQIERPDKFIVESECVHIALPTVEPEVPVQEKEFEDWVKPHIEGMVPVYGREKIDYITMEEFELMGKTVYAEAETEEFEGKVAVADVILNRVESENFPDTVEEVIKQDGAFSTWKNGSIEAAPLDDECLEAVQDAVNGRTFPESVVYFREGHFHSFGIPYVVIDHHYFSSEEKGEEKE